MFRLGLCPVEIAPSGQLQILDPESQSFELRQQVTSFGYGYEARIVERLRLRPSFQNSVWERKCFWKLCFNSNILSRTGVWKRVYKVNSIHLNYRQHLGRYGFLSAYVPPLTPPIQI